MPQSPEYRCVKAFPQVDASYPKLVCEGNEFLERGDARKALDAYQRAAKLNFFESPNFLIHYRIAAAQCSLGQRKLAVDTIEEFEVMLALYAGEKSCQDKTVENSRAADVMCAEGYDPSSYVAAEGKSARKAIARSYREKVRTLKKVCLIQ